MRNRFIASTLISATLIVCQLLGAAEPPPLPHVVDVGPRPNPPDKEIARLLGDYGDEQTGVHTYERGHLMARIGKNRDVKLAPLSPDMWEDTARKRFIFRGDAAVPAASVEFNGAKLPRRDYGAEADARARALIKVDEKLIAEARRATPPAEKGKFREPDLVALAALDPTIKLDIRYATPNNFAGYAVYPRPAAFMQRPAAEAVVRAHRFLRKYGYGIAVHDSYRPWYVTKVFWDATPAEGKIFVADPAEGSRHNRGAAIDLTMYELASGKIVEMPGRYDEMSARSYPDYFGGTSLQRWRRDLLRYAMEQQGFDVYPYEWWHFDYKDWREYPILNVDFDAIGAGKAIAPIAQRPEAPGEASRRLRRERLDRIIAYEHRIQEIRPVRREAPLRYLNIRDSEVQEIRQVAKGVFPGEMVYIAGVVTGCPCEDGLNCSDQVWIVTDNKKKLFDGILLSKVDEHWTIGPVQSWWLERDRLTARYKQFKSMDEYTAAEDELTLRFPACPMEIDRLLGKAETAK